MYSPDQTQINKYGPKRAQMFKDLQVDRGAILEGYDWLASEASNILGVEELAQSFRRIEALLNAEHARIMEMEKQ